MERRRVAFGNQNELLGEIEKLRSRLSFVEETLRAIHSDEVDAIIMQSPQGEKVFTFEEAERPYRVLIEEMSEGAVCLDSGGAILYCNQFFERLMAADHGDLIGLAFSSFVSQEDRETLRFSSASVFPKEAKVNLMALNRQAIPCRLAVNRLKLKGAIDIGIIVTDLRERLETERLLQQKFREAQAANKMKDEFLATVSHELRTPLNVISGNAKLLPRLKAGSADFIAAIEAIDRNIHVQTRIVEDILDISKIVRGKMLLKRERVDLSLLLQDSLAHVREQAVKKNITISQSVTIDEPFLIGDGDRIRQVVWNLLSNAMKFTPERGEVQIRISGLQDSVLIEIQDNGEGIDPEFLPHIFDRFTQEDSSSTRAHGGLGLGLAIVRHLVDAQGGTIRAESEGKGRGAKFVVCLPKDGSPAPHLTPLRGGQ